MSFPSTGSVIEGNMIHHAATPWLLWAALNILLVGYFTYALLAPPSSVKAAWLPGKTTHGHFQIELDCNACHAASNADEKPSSSDVMQNACLRCHEEQLRLVNDTHPAKKFNDPTNADRLAILNAQDCLTCHREHVPEQTREMGLTVPSDFCWHCHQDVADDRPSHNGMKFDSCATAGCHNYHDNRALYEKFLDEHYGELDHLVSAFLPARDFGTRWVSQNLHRRPLSRSDGGIPQDRPIDQGIVDEWAQTSHAMSGVGCRDCHASDDGESTATWSDSVSMITCSPCHVRQVVSFQAGKHGMRLAAGMSPMEPSMARLPMHVDAAHRQLTCNACHAGHRFDTQFAAVDACQSCHANSHSLAYSKSSHAELWRAEVNGDGPLGSGVTCATCHLPRIADDVSGDGGVWVNHDQNSVLRPSETMAREVCGHCHGLEFSLSALADPALAISCYDEPPSRRIQSVQMAHDYFESRRQKQADRTKN